MEFFETSAKTSMNVEDAYLCIARQCMSRLSKTEAKSSSEKSSSESSEKVVLVNFWSLIFRTLLVRIVIQEAAAKQNKW